MSNPPQPATFENGLTVAELKRIVNRWPDADSLGAANNVFLMYGLGKTQEVCHIWPISLRGRPSGEATDMMFIDATYPSGA